MIITWHGHYTVKISTSGTILILDPHDKSNQQPAFRGKAHIVALSNPQEPSMSYLDGITGEPTVINTPGEYSIAGLTLHAPGWLDASNTERSFHLWSIENITIVHLGALTRMPTDDELQHLEKTTVDILLLPVGAEHSLPLKDAISLITIIEPRVVIPIAYKDIKAFTQQVGVDPNNQQDKFTTSRSKLPEEGLETVILSR